jgi:amino acid transporter
LTLEYGVSSSAVARNWGEKFVNWVHRLGYDIWNPTGITGTLNIWAGLIEVACVGIMLRGVNMSQVTVNVFTVGKMALVAFMTIGGFVLFKAPNLKPFAPSGARGIFRGAMQTFFGYLGYDEVCCLGAEAKDPHRNVSLPHRPPAPVCGHGTSPTDDHSSMCDV